VILNNGFSKVQVSHLSISLSIVCLSRRTTLLDFLSLSTNISPSLEVVPVLQDVVISNTVSLSTPEVVKSYFERVFETSIHSSIDSLSRQVLSFLMRSPRCRFFTRYSPLSAFNFNIPSSPWVPKRNLFGCPYRLSTPNPLLNNITFSCFGQSPSARHMHRFPSHTTLFLSNYSRRSPRVSYFSRDVVSLSQDYSTVHLNQIVPFYSLRTPGRRPCLQTYTVSFQVINPYQRSRSKIFQVIDASSYKPERVADVLCRFLVSKSPWLISARLHKLSSVFFVVKVARLSMVPVPKTSFADCWFPTFLSFR